MILSASPVVNLYRVEVSGWDNNKAFFVENSELEWSEESQTGDVAPQLKPRRGGVFAAAAAHEHGSPEPCGLRGRTGFVHGARPPAIPSAPDFLSAKPADGILKQVSLPQGSGPRKFKNGTAGRNGMFSGAKLKRPASGSSATCS